MKLTMMMMMASEIFHKTLINPYNHNCLLKETSFVYCILDPKVSENFSIQMNVEGMDMRPLLNCRTVRNVNFLHVFRNLNCIEHDVD